MIGRIFSGIGEARAARRMRKDQEKALRELKESDYISPALLEAEGEARRRANVSRYSGQDIDESNIRAAGANALDAISRSTTSSANLVNAAVGVQNNTNRAMQNVSRNLQEFKSRNRGSWTNLLMQKAGQQLNNRRQYEATKAALQGAIMQNRARQSNAIWNALGGVADGALAYATGGAGAFAGRLRKGGFGGGVGLWEEMRRRNAMTTDASLGYEGEFA